MTPSPSSPDSQRHDGELPTLPDEITPPPDLERAVIAGMAQEGLLHPGSRRPRWRPLAAAAVLLAAGYLGGRWSAPPRRPAEEGARFVLLLEETAATATPTGDALDQQIEANRQWARGLASEGRLVLAEKLGGRGYAVATEGGEPRVTDAPEADRLGGFFIIQAADLDEALALARHAPHVAYGGRIVVRPVDPT